WASAWRSPSGLSNSSTERSSSKARSAAARHSPCGSLRATRDRRRQRQVRRTRSPVLGPQSGATRRALKSRSPRRGRRAGALSEDLEPHEESNMFRTLVKTEAVAVEDQTYSVRYFESRTLRGTRRYSAEILLGPDDRIILDDDSVMNLETKAT